MTRPPTAPQTRRVTLALLGAILAILIGWVLMSLAAVTIPVVLAVFVTLMVLPLDRAIAARLPGPLQWLGRVAILALLLLLIALFVGGLAYCVQQIATHLPGLSGQLDALLPAQPDGGGGVGENGSDGSFLSQVRGLVQGRADAFGSALISTAESMATMIANATGLVVSGTILVLFLVLLALSEAGTWTAKLDGMLPLQAAPNLRRVPETLGATLRSFLLVRSFVGVLTAAAYVGWMMPFGLDLLTVWAILTVLMTFIPNLGSVISALLPTFYAFLTLDFGSAMAIGAGLVVIEQVIGNYLDPKFQGNRVALSPLVILIAVVFWGSIWGIPGAFLGTPMTLALMIVANAVPPMRPLALLLSNRTRARDLDAALGWPGKG